VAAPELEAKAPAATLDLGPPGQSGTAPYPGDPLAAA